MKLQKKEKLKFKLILCSISFIMILHLLTNTAFSTYFSRQIISNSTITTGLLSFIVSPTEYEIVTSAEKTELVKYQLTNTGTLPIQIVSSSIIYNCPSLGINGIYEYSLTPFTTFIPNHILQPGESATFEYVFSIENDTSCRIKTEVQAWQTNFTLPNKGFTDTKEINTYITFLPISSPINPLP